MTFRCHAFSSEMTDEQHDKKQDKSERRFGDDGAEEVIDWTGVHAAIVRGSVESSMAGIASSWRIERLLQASGTSKDHSRAQRLT